MKKSIPARNTKQILITSPHNSLNSLRSAGGNGLLLEHNISSELTQTENTNLKQTYVYRCPFSEKQIQRVYVTQREEKNRKSQANKQWDPYGFQTETIW